MRSDNIAFTASIPIGFVAAFTIVVLPLLIYWLFRRRSSRPRKMNIFGIIFLAVIVGSISGCIAGFITGIGLGEFYGPLTGAMGGSVGGFVGGLIGGIFVYRFRAKSRDIEG